MDWRLIVSIFVTGQCCGASMLFGVGMAIWYVGAVSARNAQLKADKNKSLSEKLTEASVTGAATEIKADDDTNGGRRS